MNTVAIWCIKNAVALITCFYLTPADATISLSSSVYDVSEGNGSVSVCVVLSDIPAGGLECEIEVPLQTNDEAKAGLFYNIATGVGIFLPLC